MNVFLLEGWLSLALVVALLGLKIFALASAARFSPEAYEAAGKLTKNAWLAILGIALVLQLPIGVGGGALFGLLSLAGTVAAIVYVVDVRPALAELTRRR